jgi:regulatory protein
MSFGTSGRKPKLLERDALLNYAVKTLSSRAMSIGEIKQKLKAKAANEPDVDEVLSSLKQYGYLNDRAFADTYAASRRDNQSLGSMRVLRDLRVKRVASTVAEQAVKQAFDGRDEEALIEQFLARKYRSAGDLSVYLKDEKRLASAYRRLRTAGYSSGNSIRVLKRYAAMAEQLEAMEPPEEPEDNSASE